MSKKKRIHSSILDSNSEELRRGAAEAEKRGSGGRSDAPSSKIRSANKTAAEKGKSLYFIFVIGVSVVLAAFIIFKGVLNINEGLTSEIKIYETDITGVADGTYTGEYSTAQMSAAVSVSIVSERISAIRLDKYTGIDPKRAQTVIDNIIMYQQLNDPNECIGGEHTDKIVQRAVMDALANALEENRVNGDGDAGIVSDENTEQVYYNTQSA